MAAQALPALRAVADFPDPELLRFWRAAKKELSAAKAALRATVAWRKDRAAELQGADAQLVSSWLSVIGEDAHGWPVYCIAPSAIAVDDVGRVSDERVVAIVINAFETLRSEVRRLGADDDGLALMVDLRAVQLQHIWNVGVRAVHGLITIGDTHFPEMIRHLLVHTACATDHWLLPRPWTVLRPLLSDATLSRTTSFRHARDCLPSLEEHAAQLSLRWLSQPPRRGSHTPLHGPNHAAAPPAPPSPHARPPRSPRRASPTAQLVFCARGDAPAPRVGARPEAPPTGRPGGEGAHPQGVDRLRRHHERGGARARHRVAPPCGNAVPPPCSRRVTQPCATAV